MAYKSKPPQQIPSHIDLSQYQVSIAVIESPIGGSLIQVPMAERFLVWREQ